MNPAEWTGWRSNQIFTPRPGQFGGTLSWYASPKADAFPDGLLAADAEWVLERCARGKTVPSSWRSAFPSPLPMWPPAPYFGKYPREEMPLVTG
ncbi:MAG: hypothetical protein R3F31_10165 [Verrucomicrobiales bacterium]